MLAACNASLAASLLLLLKHFLIAAYALTCDRVAAYHPGDTDRRRAEEQRTVVRHSAKMGFHVLRLDAGDMALLRQQAQVCRDALPGCNSWQGLNV